MASSFSDTASPTPFSPFSTHSASSDLATSDEIPDLGAFTTVFRVLNELQPRQFPFVQAPLPPSSSSHVHTPSLLSPLEYDDSDTQRDSTVWNQQPIASYLSLSSRGIASSRGTRSLPPSPPASDDETEGELEIDDDTHDGTDQNDDDDRDDQDDDQDELASEYQVSWAQPSLGYLDEALDFIAAERAKLVTQRETVYRGSSSTSEGPWRSPPASRRKRRRKKAKSLVRTILRREPAGEDTAEGTTQAADPAVDVDESSSSLEDGSSPYYKSTPATPPQRKKERRAGLNVAVNKNPRLSHSKSTPSLRMLLAPVDPKIIRLRALAMKLRVMFPEDADRLAAVLSNDTLHSSFNFFPSSHVSDSTSGQPLTHVFIDFSNILIGYLNHLRRHPHHQHPHNHTPSQTHKRTSSNSGSGASSGTSAKVTKHLSHAALALILERSRPVTRRVLAASSPLYQPMQPAEEIGYEVRVYARVPDTGDGADRLAKLPAHDHHWKGKGRMPSTGRAPTKGHARRASAGAASTSNESEPNGHVAAGVGHGGQAQGQQQASSSSLSTSPSKSHLHANNHNAHGRHSLQHANSTGRVKMREQGVDELLQLKLHQAIADVDVPPPGSTIVLATGDGNVGQFNEEGFVGCVKTALKKGWQVELYAWEGGLARAWVREFGDGGNPRLSWKKDGRGVAADEKDKAKDKEGGDTTSGSSATGQQQQQWPGKFRIVLMDHFGADLFDG